MDLYSHRVSTFAEQQYEEDTETLKELMNDPDAMEKVAREKYLMKKPNEDVFIFEE